MERRSELCTPQIDDIQVNRRAVFVEEGKGRVKRDRYVPIGTRALTWIARYVETVRDQLATNDGNRALFLTIHGKSIAPNTLTEYGRRYLSSAGIDKPGACHIYRHSMATQMHENGADLTLIQQILGHAKSDTTQIYARTSLRRLLAIHDTTHPASQPESDGENFPQ